MRKYSTIIPIYNEEKTLQELYTRLTNVMEKLTTDYEIIFVNDGSTDKSFEVIKGLRQKDKRVKTLNFSRNFGHQIAITAGTDFADAEAVIWMDGDLQDPPEVIPELVDKWKRGYEVVYATRKKRKGESVFKLITAKIFYRIFRKIANIDLPVDAGDFRLIDRKAIEKFKELREQHRFIRGLSKWIGFNQTRIKYVRDVRRAGVTKYSVRKMLKFCVDAILSFSFFPIRLVSYFGIFISFICFLYICFAIIVKLATSINLMQGWTSLIVAVLFLGGVQLISLGIIGEYIGRIYEEVKNRPLYVIKDAIGFKD